MIENPEKCRTCQTFGVVEGGDIVPYGSTTARLPEYYGCLEGYDYNDTGEQIDVSKCTHYKELPKCSKHPNDYVYPRAGCGACETDYYEEEMRRQREREV